ncbi:uncharacterized protein LOC135207474 [Macrobrachium nipponense]|uniref:uncharacterized protein LOC135207474 n=1 Tax=Macrobrachium nipponense TaxID=159736 RepID=UPI0030C7F644
MLRHLMKWDPRLTSCSSICRRLFIRSNLGKESDQHSSRHEIMEASVGKCKVLNEEEICRGKWLALHNYHWQDQNSKERVWEVVSRTTRKEQPHDVVAIVATVTGDSIPKSLILVKQFRPPLKNYTIEVPAGLVDDNESAEDAALRELKEETGYTGVITGISGIVALDPGISNITMKIVSVKVDGSASVNQNVSKVCGVDGEHTEVLLVPLSSLQSALAEFASAGMIVDSRVGAFALGLSIMNNKT